MTNFYSDLKPELANLYQKYFNQMLDAVNVQNLTDRSMSRHYNGVTMESDYDKIEKILDNAEKEGLISSSLQVMFEQYIFADVYQREMYKNKWVIKVLNRKDTDFFPDPVAVLNVLYPKINL